MDTREILPKADEVAGGVRAPCGRQNPSDDKDLGRRESDFSQSGARGGGHWQAGGAGPGGQAGGLF